MQSVFRLSQRGLKLSEVQNGPVVIRKSNLEVGRDYPKWSETIVIAVKC